MHFCTKCGNMYYIRIGPTAAVPGVGNAETVQQASASDAADVMNAADAAANATALYHYCRNCGHELKIEKTICVSSCNSSTMRRVTAMS